MKKIELSQLEEWYKKQLKKRFSKEHKFMQKRIFSKAQEEIGSTKFALKSWVGEEKYERSKAEGQVIPEKTQKIIERFVEKIQDALNEIKIPGVDAELSYTDSIKFCEQVRTLYQQYNVEGKKSLPRFRKYYNMEIKEIDMHLRKIGESSSKTASFLRKKYPGGKEAEALLRKIPNIEHNISQLGTARNTYEEMSIKVEKMEKELETLKKEYDEISQSEEIIKLKQTSDSIRKEHRSLRTTIKYNKAFKKLRKGMEDGTLKYPDINVSDLRKYTKAPVLEILNEGASIPRLREVLIRVRLILEDPQNPLKLKKDLRDRIIENMNEIINEKILEPKIEGIKQLEETKKNLKKSLEEKGIYQKREELRDKIQTLTVDLEHFTNDLKHKKRDYDSLLQKVIQYREFLESKVLEETGKKVKINIIIPE
jgi:hypothetical protein